MDTIVRPNVIYWPNFVSRTISIKPCFTAIQTNGCMNYIEMLKFIFFRLPVAHSVLKFICFEANTNQTSLVVYFSCRLCN